MEAHIYDGKKLIGRVKLDGPSPSPLHKEDEIWYGSKPFSGGYQAHVHVSRIKVPERHTGDLVDLPT